MRYSTLLITALMLFPIASQSQNLDSLLKPVKYRNVGPFRGGRSVAACGVKGDPLTYFMGTTGGGLWKTNDAGIKWSNVSDGYFKTGSVGAVAVSDSDPNVVYCGMGEHAPRGVMTSYGDGVYKSTDQGKTWRHVGLKKTQHISRIIIHPKNPDIVYVAAQGALHAPNEERGVFKSVDGGKTWKKVLYVNTLTGCSELAIDLSNPDVLYAGMWYHQRKPWKVISGGEGSGMWKSTDGGETWKEINKGLPSPRGKIAVSVCQSNPSKLYALVEGDSQKEKGGLFGSSNGGDSWSRISGEHQLIQRSWYYTEVFADPQDEYTLYVLSAPCLRSIDGGKSWKRIGGTHGDFHDLWINPDNPKNLCIANDGGAAVSFNRGASWSSQSIMPTAQIYRLNVDNLYPYSLYGGQQDNSSIKIQNTAIMSGGISDQNWESSAGGESAFLAFDPDNPRYVAGGSYEGTIEILDMESRVSTSVMAAPIQYLGRDAKDMKYRFNWNAPIIWSKHEPGTFYHCSQMVLKSSDNGINWKEISPDLTRNEKDKQGKPGGPLTNEAVGAENYGTISYMIESPTEKGVFWVGSDDGLVHITKDGGATWTNVTPKNMEECLVNAIDISPHDPATAYIATTRYKFNDYTPALYKTTDYGKSWTNISEGIPYGAFTRVIREDEKKKDLLYAGTETGMYISYDGGKKWSSFQLNLPVVPITDMMCKHNDLIVATAGRSFWILDDMELIRNYNEADSLALYQPEPSNLARWWSPLNGNSSSFTGSNSYTGVNPANGVVLYYSLPKLADTTQISLTIKDASGKEIRKFSSKGDPTFKSYAGGPPRQANLPKKRGLNRFFWDMSNATMKGAPTVYIEGNFSGRRVVPGTYTLELKVGSETKTTTVDIQPNPMIETTPEQYKEYDEYMAGMEATMNEMHEAVNKVKSYRDQISAVVKNLPKEDKYASLKAKGNALVKKMKAWDDEMVQRKSKAYDDVENYPNKFTAEYIFLINQTYSDVPQVTQPSRDRRVELEKQWESLKKRADAFIETDVPAFNKECWENGIGAIQDKK